MARPVGSKNKNGEEIRAMIRGALKERGGQKWLEAQMDANPVAFMGLIGKVIPKDVEVEMTVNAIERIAELDAE